MTEPQARPEEPPGAPAPPVDRLSQDMAEVARYELLRIRNEVLDTVRGVGAGAAMLAGAGVLGALAVQSASTTLLRALEANMSPGKAAATLTVTYVAAAGALALLGIGRLRVARNQSGGVSREVRRVLPDVREGLSSAGE